MVQDLPGIDRSAHRPRKVFIALAFATIGIGLCVHLFGSVLDPAARDVAGDALWAMMIYWLIGAIAPRMSLIARSAVSYAICVTVELSQLYHTPSLDALRATAPGHLVLGNGFDARDLIAYAAGVAIACLAEAVAASRSRA